MTKIRFLVSILALVLLIGVALVAQPKRNISAARHPNLAAAQRLSQQAYERIAEAQRANEWDMEGHAQKAKDLLEQVNNHLKMAAEAANKNK
jgi:membrane protein required for beta-lactamase induction